MKKHPKRSKTGYPGWLRRFIENVQYDLKNENDLNKIIFFAKIMTLVVGSLALLIGALSLYYGVREANREIDPKVRDMMATVEETEKLANEVMNRLASKYLVDASFPVEKMLILGETEVDGEDLNIKFSYTTSHDSSFAKLMTKLDNYKPGQVSIEDKEAELIYSTIDAVINDQLDWLSDQYDVYPKVTGVSDNVPVKPGTRYSQYEPAISSITYYNINEERHKSKTLIPGKTILENEDFAFLRAYNLVRRLENLNLFRGSPFEIQVYESDKVGDRYTVFEVQIEVRDYLKEPYEDLSLPGKIAYDIRNLFL